MGMRHLFSSGILPLLCLVAGSTNISHRYHRHSRQASSLPIYSTTTYGQRQTQVYILESAIGGLSRMPRDLKSRYLEAAANVWDAIEELIQVESSEEVLIKAIDLEKMADLVANFREQALSNLELVHTNTNEKLTWIKGKKSQAMTLSRALNKEIHDFKHDYQSCTGFLSKISLEWMLRRCQKFKKDAMSVIMTVENFIKSLDIFNRALLDLEDERRDVRVYFDRITTSIYGLRRTILELGRELKSMNQLIVYGEHVHEEYSSCF